MNKIWKYMAICIPLMLSFNLHAQSISASQTTAAGNTIRKGNLSFTYSIGRIGSGILQLGNTGKPATGTTPHADITPSPTTPATVSAYPNPFTAMLKVVFPYKEEAPRPTAQLIDNTGKVMPAAYSYRYSQGKGQIEIMADNLPQGKYIIRILTNQMVLTTSAIKI